MRAPRDETHLVTDFRKSCMSTPKDEHYLWGLFSPSVSFLKHLATNGKNSKMKLVIISLLFLLFACGPESSPEGRSRIRDEKIQKQVDSMVHQNQAILDTLTQLRKDLQKIKISK